MRPRVFHKLLKRIIARALDSRIPRERVYQELLASTCYVAIAEGRSAAQSSEDMQQMFQTLMLAKEGAERVVALRESGGVN
jgi:hypothetical protein